MIVLIPVLFFFGCSQRGTFQTEIPTPAKDCDHAYIKCMREIKIKDRCDKSFDDCDLGTKYNLEEIDVD